jgi:PAS domain S-box-containing protein
MARDNNVIEVPAFIAAAFEDSPIPMSVYDREGFQIYFNAAHQTMWNMRPEDTWGKFNMITEPQLAATGSAENHRRVMNGEVVVLPPHSFDPAEAGYKDARVGRRWVESTYYPLHDASGNVTHMCAFLRDVTREVEQTQVITRAQEEIAAQRATIESLSSPVIQVWQGILTMPLVGVIDSLRAQNITSNLLEAISRQQAHCVILDITGVPIVDTQVAQHIIQSAQAARLLGCEVVLVGVGVEIAQTLVQLGVDLSTLKTLANLQAAIAWAFSQLNLAIVRTPASPARR